MMKRIDLEKKMTLDIGFKCNPDSLASDIDKFGYLMSKKLNQKVDSLLVRETLKDSMILPESFQKPSLVELFPPFSSNKLLYRLSQDGPGNHTFHFFCDNKGPTLTLVKLESGAIFGVRKCLINKGYAAESWNSIGGW